ncbi:MAG: hypothetical protein KAR08_01260, partial [Candidatus Heimdallarchaeota archaeon]|nr:hypothetical protein [Candidatus Heimdallarchaeota archaeon]
MRENFDITAEEAKTIELIMDNEFKMNEFPDFLKKHPEINLNSFMTGFLACILTCVEFEVEGADF